MSTSPEPIAIVVAALGGEGGGVLTDWLAEAGRRGGLRVQCTSIPGVAQRTGATTYYIEMAPSGYRAALALTPMPGSVDVLVASELIEAARATQNGYVTPDRTTVVASTHRVYATSEKSAMGDGRFDSQRALEAVTTLANRSILFDMGETSRTSRSAISAVMLGAVAGAQILPIRREIFEEVIRHSGVAVDTNLAGFAAAFARASSARIGPAIEADAAASRAPRATQAQDTDALKASARQRFPTEALDVIDKGIDRLRDFQDEAYAELYLDRLLPVLALERQLNAGEGRFELLKEVARHLALRMSYEDLIRVADLKTRRSRFERVRTEIAAKPEEPVRVIEYFKPGLEEFCSFLPPAIARRLLAWAERRGKLDSFNVGLHIRTSHVTGFTLLWLTSRMKPLRRLGYRYACEQQNVTEWLSLVVACGHISHGFALEMAAAARLIKGYSGTYRNGMANYTKIVADLVKPAVGGHRDAAAELKAAVSAALTHGGPEIKPAAVGYKPLKFVRNRQAAPDVEAAEARS